MRSVCRVFQASQAQRMICVFRDGDPYLCTSSEHDRAIDVQILRLRRKIEPDCSQPRYIITERGVGYSFKAPVETVY